MDAITYVLSKKYTNKKVQEIVDLETPVDAMARLASVDANGVDYLNLKTRLDTEQQEISSQLAELAGKFDITEVQPKNLFDISTKTDGYTLSASTGNLSASASFFVSDFIPVTAGSKITSFYVENGILKCGGVSRIIAYNANKTFNASLGAIAGSTTAVNTVTIPENAEYIRIASPLSTLTSGLMVCLEVSEYPPKITEYGEVIVKLKDSSYLELSDLYNLPFMNGTKLTNGADLDTLTDGVYYMEGTSNIATLVNSPTVTVGGLKIIVYTMAGGYKIQQLFATDNKMYYRIKTSVYGNWVTASDNLKKLTLSTDIKKATYGPAISPALPNYTPTGGAVFSTDKWIIPPNGSIKHILPLVAGTMYRITLAATSSTTTEGSKRGELRPTITLSMGEQSIKHYIGNDSNWNSAFLATTTGDVEFSIATDGVVTLNVSAIRILPVTKYADMAVDINGMPFYAYGQSTGFGGQDKMLYGAVDESMGDIDTLCGVKNTSFGEKAQDEMTTGCWNSAFGYMAQAACNHGKGNTAMGTWAQAQLTSGYYNNAFGESAQGRLTSGNWNDAHGIEAQGWLTEGCNNVCMGRRSQHKLTTGSRNVAIGAWSGFMANDMSPEGAWATTTANNQTLVGASATQSSEVQADNLTAIGYRARGTTDATAIGMEAKASGVGSIALGKGVVADEDNEMVLGGANITKVILAGKVITFNEDGSVTWTNA